MSNTGTPADVAPSEAPTPDGARVTGPALDAHYRFLLWLVPAVERFPRSQKFLLGDRIQRTALDVLECLLEATYTRQRGHHLTRANLGIEKLRVLIRLAHDLHVLLCPAGGRLAAAAGSERTPLPQSPAGAAGALGPRPGDTRRG